MADPARPRSCYDKVGRLVYFGRMIDKIRLHAAGRLPPEYVSNLGEGKPTLFDARCCRFLGVAYAELRQRVLEGQEDEALLAWAHERGGPKTDEVCEMWNGFMMKVGWRDDRSAVLRTRIKEYRLEGRPIETFFDLNDYDEGRDPAASRPWDPLPPLIILLMGVAGSGKTTVGRRLAETLGWGFADADEFHPPANVAKMSSGQPLDDEDRAPWLAAIRTYIESRIAAGTPAVVTCSALKERYRAAVAPDPSRLRLVHLTADPAVLRERISGRQGHFMKADMLQSQLDALEPPKGALSVDVSAPPDVLVGRILDGLRLGPRLRRP